MVELTREEATALKKWIEWQYQDDVHEIEDYVACLEKEYESTHDLRNALKKLGVALK
jgi:hypothetical protein